MSSIILRGYGNSQLIATQGFGTTSFVNPLDVIKILLIDEWNSANTDSVTPTIVKKYEHPKGYKLAPSEDVIYIQTLLSNMLPSGLGFSTYADLIENITIDIRSRHPQNSLTSDTHARKVLYEVLRIIKDNINEYSTKYRVISQEITYEDTSQLSVGLSRRVLNISLKDYFRNII